uniref:Free fatty acid receptor 1 n=1 Tax=Chelonoidis abingdonii TaxID=106734 RepID=A0A8C0QSL1_CHEAB
MDPVDTLALAIYSVTILLGLPANILALYIFYHRARARLTPNLIYMINLCLSDLAFILILPLKILEVVPPGWSPTSFLCPLYSLAHFGTVYASTCFLTAVSAGRYLGAAFPIRYQLYKKPLYSCLVCVAIWTLVAFHGILLLILETSLGANATLFMGNGSACYQEFSPEQLALLAPVRLELSVALFFLPLAIMVFCYASCIHVLIKSRLHEQKKRREVRLAVATLSVFVLCFGPYNLSHVVGYARSEDVWWRRVALLPSACNAFLDPLIFYFLSSAKDQGLAWVWRSMGQRLGKGTRKRTLVTTAQGKCLLLESSGDWTTGLLGSISNSGR